MPQGIERASTKLATLTRLRAMSRWCAIVGVFAVTMAVGMVFSGASELAWIAFVPTVVALAIAVVVKIAADRLEERIKVRETHEERSASSARPASKTAGPRAGPRPARVDSEPAAVQAAARSRVEARSDGGELIRSRLSEALLEEGLIDRDGLRNARQIEKQESVSFPEAVLKLARVPEQELISLLCDLFELEEEDRTLPLDKLLLKVSSQLWGVPGVDLDELQCDPLILELIEKRRAFALNAIPLYLEGDELTVAMADPHDLAKLDELRFLTGKTISPRVALLRQLRHYLTEYYGEQEAPSLELLQFEASSYRTSLSLSLDGREVDEPVINLVNRLFARAIQTSASDIHLEPYDEQVVVRYRIDGRLHVRPYDIPISALPSLVTRIKVLAGLDITEHRVPQDGRIRIEYAGRRIEVRVSTFPTIRGQKIVLRLLDKDLQDFHLDNLGMSPEFLTAWLRMIHRKQGILLVTGPTGSGKTSTQYATLRQLHQPEINIVTLEDPVEYELEGVAQAQVHDRAGFTFAKGLRAILRQDPEIILVGEIRDLETAQIAVRAAQTGHLVLATLHTNDAPTAVVRLIDMGLASYLVASAVIGVLAQRLVRKLCPDCAREVEPSDQDRLLLGEWLGVPGLPFLEGRGCSNCLGTGFRGRTGVYELLSIDRKLTPLIVGSATSLELMAAASQNGYQPLWFDGLEKVRERVTSLRELARAVEKVDQSELDALALSVHQGPERRQRPAGGPGRSGGHGGSRKRRGSRASAG